VKSGYSSNNGSDHKEKRNNRPDNSPALRRTSIFTGKNACVGAVHFAENEIVALFGSCGEYQTTGEGFRKSYNIPDAVKARHNTYKKLDEQSF